MTILSIVTALVLGFVLFGWLQLGALISVIAAIGTFIILSLILRKGGSTIIQEGTQIIIPSDPMVNNVGSEKSPFGTVRSE